MGKARKDDKTCTDGCCKIKSKFLDGSVYVVGGRLYLGWTNMPAHAKVRFIVRQALDKISQKDKV